MRLLSNGGLLACCFVLLESVAIATPPSPTLPGFVVKGIECAGQVKSPPSKDHENDPRMSECMECCMAKIDPTKDATGFASCIAICRGPDPKSQEQTF